MYFINATANLSSTPAKEGIQKMQVLIKGDSEFEVTKNSPRGVRKAVVKTLQDLYIHDQINYVTYCYYSDLFGFRPKKHNKIKANY